MFGQPLFHVCLVFVRNSPDQQTIGYFSVSQDVVQYFTHFDIKTQYFVFYNIGKFKAPPELCVQKMSQFNF